MFYLMVYILIDFIYLDISTLFILLIFCLCVYINICKSETNLVVHNNKVSSQYSPDKKNSFLSNSRWDDFCWSVGKQQSQNWIKRLVLSFKIVF